MSEETPLHHQPSVQGMHLMSDEAVFDAWKEFFRLARQLADQARRRTADEAQNVGTDDTTVSASAKRSA